MKSLLPILLMLLTAAVFGQVKISGVISDGKGQAIPGANIFLENTFDGTSSNERGIFEFQTSEKGTKVLIATFIGFKDFKKQILIADRDLTIEIFLEETI